MSTFLEKILSEENQPQSDRKKDDNYLDKLLNKENSDLPQGPHQGQRMMFEAVKNFPESLYNVGLDLVNAVTNPVDTAMAVGDLARATGNKIGRKAAELTTGQEIEPMPEYPEEAANIVGEGIKNRWGSPENALRTVVKDPAGAMLDVAGVGSVVPKVARVVEPLGGVYRAGQEALRGSRAAERTYSGALNIPKNMTPEQRSQIARTGIDERVPVSPTGVQRVQDVKKSLEEGLNDMIANVEGVNRAVPKPVVIQYFDELMKKYKGTFDEARDTSWLKKKRQELLAMSDNKYWIDIADLHKFKTMTYQKAYKREAASPDKSRQANVKTDAMRQSARGAKETIEQRLPQYAPTNERWGRMAQLEAHLDERLKSLSGDDISLVRKVMEMPDARSRIAFLVDRVEKGELGQFEKHFNSAEIRAALALAGRYEDSLEDEAPLQVPIQNGRPQ